MNPFAELKEIGEPKNKGERKFRSEAEDSNGNPIVVIKEEGETLILSFIRSTKDYPFKETMKKFLCYAEKNGFIRVKLEDDALFSDGECMYRALFYRVLTGKDSLYVDQGFKPTVGVSVEKDILSKASVRTIKNFLPAEFQSKIKNISDNDFFRNWIFRQKNENCMLMRELINKIDTIARQQQLKPNNSLSNEAKQFLTSWRKYYLAHTDLQRDPACSEGGGGLRSRTRSSSRGKYQRRNTRKNRRNRKMPGRTRNSRK